MPMQVLCVSPALASLRGGVPIPRARSQIRDWAAGRSITTSVFGTGLLLRRPWVTPIASFDDEVSSAGVAGKTNQHADLPPIEGKMRTALLRGTNQKRWVVQSSNSEQSQEISEDKSSEENNGPPVLTIIAGLLVILVVFWALSSLVSWIVGLILK